MATGGGAGTPGPAVSSWRCRSCGRSATSPTGCSSGAGGPNRRSSAWSPPPICSASAPAGWRSWSRLWASPGSRSRRCQRWPKISTHRWRRSELARWTPARTPFVAADALVLKVREAGRTVNVHALLANGVNADGYREILGLHVTSAEDGAGWLGFFRDLTARGLSGVKLVTSDAHRGLVEAIGATLPGASWQRCRTHYAANLMSATHAGSGSRSNRARATSTASRVLPTPPGPTSVVSRYSAASLVTAAISASRPTKLVSGVGRFARRPAVSTGCAGLV